MKEKIIETAGKTWKTLGQKGEMAVDQLPKVLNEDSAVCYQSLGWLAREDKIRYTQKNSQTFVSLVDSELRAFKNLFQPAQKQSTPTPPATTQSATAKKKTKI